MEKVLNDFITYETDIKTMSKTEDTYIDVIFKYRNVTWNGAIPINYRYYGNKVEYEDIEKLEEWIELCYGYLSPETKMEWEAEVQKHWKNSTGKTKEVFDALNLDKNLSTWKCRTHETGRVNDQSAARIKNMKERGFVILTERKYCEICKSSKIFDLLVRLPIYPAGVVKRYNLSEKQKKEIYRVLGNKDVFFNTKKNSKELVIDHKFPSSRWENGEMPNEKIMTAEDIKSKFQLLTNQSNLIKERKCQNCVKNNIRGDFLGINWFHEGDQKWQGESKYDEKGCIGCPWYDLETWKNKLDKKLNE